MNINKVQIKLIDGKSRLYVNEKEFYITGAGCEFGSIEKMGQYGANAMRTWRTNNGKDSGLTVLNKAQKSGLMVLMGLEMVPERNGFDYSDSVATAKQFEEIRAQVKQYKTHPALLGWIIGNELNLFYKNPDVWDAVDKIAQYIHSEDPNHPVTTTLAGISKDVVDQIKKRAPHIDFLSIQMYGDIVNLQKRIHDAEWTGPYVVTEWGATGHWEVGQTEWKAPIEQTSTEKANAFDERYNKAILADSLNCLGSFVFVWEQKQERTPTWYGMFTELGEETESVEVMRKIWTGRYPENKVPKIDSISLNRKSAYSNIFVKPSSTLEAFVKSTDADKDTLEYCYEIMPESTDQKSGGDKEEKPEVLLSLITKNGSVNLKAPREEGAYRLFFYVRDGKGHCGTANIPFYVKK